MLLLFLKVIFYFYLWFYSNKFKQEGRGFSVMTRWYWQVFASVHLQFIHGVCLQWTHDCYKEMVGTLCGINTFLPRERDVVKPCQCMDPYPSLLLVGCNALQAVSHGTGLAKRAFDSYRRVLKISCHGLMPSNITVRCLKLAQYNKNNTVRRISHQLWWNNNKGSQPRHC